MSQGIEGGLCYAVIEVRELDLHLLNQKTVDGSTVLRLVQVPD